MIFQHSCIIPQKKKDQKYLSIWFPPTSSQQLPGFKSDKGMESQAGGGNILKYIAWEICHLSLLNLHSQ